MRTLIETGVEKSFHFLSHLASLLRVKKIFIIQGRHHSTSATDEKVEAVQKIMDKLPRMLAPCQVGPCHVGEFFWDILVKKHMAPKFVPKMLNFEQKNRRFEAFEPMQNFLIPAHSSCSQEKTKSFVTIKAIKDRIAGRAHGYIKKRISEVFRALEKALAQMCYIYFFGGGKILKICFWNTSRILQE